MKSSEILGYLMGMIYSQVLPVKNAEFTLFDDAMLKKLDTKDLKHLKVSMRKSKGYLSRKPNADKSKLLNGWGTWISS